MDNRDLSSLKYSGEAGSEALYLLKGSPTKGSKSINQQLKSDGSVDHLLQFDLRFDALRTYLEGFNTVINQHATVINQLQNDVSIRLIESNLYEVVNKLGSSCIITDKAIAGLIAPLQKQTKPENTGKKNDDTVNTFCNRLDLVTHGFSHFHKINTNFVDRFGKVEAQFIQKVNVEDFKTKVKKTKTKLRNKMDENYKTLDEKIRVLESKLQTRVDTLDRKVDELEKHTTWRIRDCEELLKTRINDQYVDDAIRLLEERLRNEMIKQNLGNTEAFDKSVKELAQRLKKCEDQIDDKVDSIKKNIKDIEIMISKKHETSKFEEFKKEILARIDTESEKLRNLTKKCDPAIDTLGGNLAKTNDEITKIKMLIKNMNEEMESLSIRITAIPAKVQTVEVTKEATTTVVQPDFSVIKAEMDVYMNKFRIELNHVKENIRSVEESLYSKVETSTFNREIAKKLDISEFESKLALFQSDADRIKRLIQGNEDLQNQILKFEDMVDKKIAKLRKDLDITALVKQLKTKAEDENVAKGFENTDKKIAAISETLLALRKEFDQASTLLEKVTQSTFSFSDNASLTVKKMNMNCLSCGNLSRTHNPIHAMPGIDGKMYKADAPGHPANLNELYDAVNQSDLRQVFNHSHPIKDERKNNLNYNYNQTVTINRVRPQTATGRGKIFKNTNNLSNATTGVIVEQTHMTFMRPGSAKK